jgi:hypothetical protein
MYPTLVSGDGLPGYAEGGPYDRVIATRGVRTVPGSCGLDRADPARWPDPDDHRRLARLVGTRTPDRPLRRHNNRATAERSSQLHARAPAHAARAGLAPPDLSKGKEREAIIATDASTDWTSRFVVQLAAQHAQRLTMERDGRTEHVLVDVESGSWVCAMWASPANPWHTACSATWDSGRTTLPLSIWTSSSRSTRRKPVPDASGGVGAGVRGCVW